MLRFSLFRSALVAALVASLGAPALADVPNVQSTATLSATGTTLPLPLSGQSVCSVVLPASGTTVGLTLVPQVSSDNGTTWVTATTIGTGSITANGTYVGAIGNLGLTNFRLNVTAITSGSVVASYGCSATVPGTLTTTPSGTQNVNVSAQSLSPIVVTTAPPCTAGTCNTTITPSGTQTTAYQTVTGSGTASAAGRQAAVNLTGQTTCALTISGTYTGGRFGVYGSADGGTTLQPISQAFAIPSNGVQTNGTYIGNVGGYGATQLYVSVLLLASGSVNWSLNCSSAIASVATTQNSTGNAFPISCNTPISVAISTATTTQIVAVPGVSGQSVYICAYQFTVTGTSPTVQFESGTGGTCGTATAAMSGVFAPTSGTVLSSGTGLGFLMQSSGSGVCLVTGGTTPSVQGWLNYTVL